MSSTHHTTKGEEMNGIEFEYELLLDNNKTAVWTGKDGVDAARRYVGMHPTARVHAWRTYPQHGIFIGGTDRILEPGDSGY